MKLKLSALAFVLLILFTPIFAQPPDYGWAGNTSTFEQAWEPPGSPAYGGMPWMEIALLCAFICFMANTLIYMLAFLTQSEELKHWVKGQYLDVTASAVLIILAVFLLTQAGAFFSGAVGDTTQVYCGGSLGSRNANQPFQIMQCRLQTKIFEFEKLYDQIYDANYPVERLKSMMIYLFGAPVWFGDMTYHQQVEGAHLVAYKITDILISLQAQYALTNYIANNMLSVFLPLGLLLRIPPPTRGLGGLLIAIAIGMYFVFPTIYVVIDPAFTVLAPTLPPTTHQVGQCYQGFKGAVTMVNDFTTFQREEVPPLNFTQIFDFVAKLSLELFFYPFVALAVTFVFIQNVAQILGGDVGDLLRMTAKVI